MRKSEGSLKIRLSVSEKRGKRLFFILGGSLSLLLFFRAGAFALGLSVSELQNKMAESDAELGSVQFNYVQEVRSSLTSEVRSSSGTAYLMKPKQFKVQQMSPEAQLMVSSGKFIFIYTPRFRQVMKEPWKKWFSKNVFFPGVLGFSDTLGKLKKEYRWEILGTDVVNGQKTIALRLETDAKKEGERLNVWVGESDFIPRKTEIVLGTLKLTTTLDHLELNPGFAPEFFQFKKPREAELIQLP